MLCVCVFYNELVTCPGRILLSLHLSSVGDLLWETSEAPLHLLGIKPGRKMDGWMDLLKVHRLKGKGAVVVLWRINYRDLFRCTYRLMHVQ